MLTNYSLIRGRLYKVVAVVVSIALIYSSASLQAWNGLPGVHVAYAAEEETLQDDRSSLTSTKSVSLQSNGTTPPTTTDTINQHDQTKGLLIDVDTPQPDIEHTPISYAPLSISRMQSAYLTGDAVSNTLIITFSITNNQLPLISPHLPVSATITDTISAVTELDPLQDPNTIHNVVVADALTDHAVFVGSSPVPDLAATKYVWNLGDIPPLGSVTATLTLRVPTTITDFIDLDTGAVAYGTLQDRMVNAKSRPISVAPDMIDGEPIGDWLKWTIDADKYDEYMLVTAAEFGQDPTRMFEYVRTLGYESYKGSLRGTRGTLWSAAGNSLDKSSLLIAMLRASGIPSRYRHGTLSKEHAQELLLSMFPASQNVIGYVPPGVRTSDPANDSTLLAEAQDHWWIEAYLPDLSR